MRSWMPFVVLTVLSWGTYIPTLHKGQLALGGSGVHAFLMVGVAYLLVAILIPGGMIARAGSWDLFTTGGMAFTVAAGVLGALGALGIVLDPPEHSPSPVFFIGILMAAAGAWLVLAYRPT